MDGKIGWLTLHYAFSWVRINRSYLETLGRQTELRWPTEWNVAYERQRTNMATVGYGKYKPY